MRILYLEPFSGISGDMMLGALLDLGVKIEDLEQQLQSLAIPGYRVSADRASRAGLHATQFHVHLREAKTTPAAHDHRSFREIREIIRSSGLSAWVKDRSIDAFRRLAEAEGKIHNRPVDEVHFHEVGAVDSIVDIVGCMIGVEGFLPARILSAPVNLGQGILHCRHGIYPAPGPATQELLRGAPTYSDSHAGELTTPTGAAILGALVERYGTRPLMRIEATGYGAGSRDLPGCANVLRITVGEELSAAADLVADDQVTVIDAAIDDVNPQVLGYFQEKAMSQGALDVYFTPVQMKKGRPGVNLTVLCAPGDADRLSRLVFAETTTIGLRYTLARRRVLSREMARVDTEYGTVTVKVSSLDGQRMNFTPEYEDCRRLAVERGVALKEVQAAAARAYLQLIESEQSMERTNHG